MANEAKMLTIERDIQIWLKKHGKTENCAACRPNVDMGNQKLCLGHEVESLYADYVKAKDKVVKAYFSLISDL
jgi:hypothetical protein